MNREHGHTTQIQICLDRLRGGDDTAREDIIAYSCDRLYRLARKLIKGYPSVQRWEDTQDVVQDASLRLHRALLEVHPESVTGFIGLAATQIRRQLIDLARHYMGPLGIGAHHDTNRPLSPSDTSEHGPPRDVADATSGPETLAEWTEFHGLVDRLPPDERAVFELHFYGELSHADAARLLGVSEKTIKRRWQSARLMLHELLRSKPRE